jgi:Rrf2 family transcriptional regulator, nitric oxide-sensitive transcriptional repressor
MRLELTRRADYAIRAMVALAAAPETVISGSRIAAVMDIPPRFVGQVMRDLVRARLAKPRSGRAGGYRLARSADTISLLEIIGAVEGDPRPCLCLPQQQGCEAYGTCGIHSVFAGAQEALLAHLSSATLASAQTLGGERRAHVPTSSIPPVVPPPTQRCGCGGPHWSTGVEADPQADEVASRTPAAVGFLPQTTGGRLSD